MNSHVYNERTKRLEPIGNQCVYCGRKKVADDSTNYYTKMYCEQSRTNVVVYRNVKYSMLQIGATRCPHCKAIHSKVKMQSILLCLLILLLGWTIIGGITAMLFPFITIIAIFLGTVGGLFFLFYLLCRVYSRIEQSLLERRMIISPRDGLMMYPIVEQLFREGFTFEQPTA